jgi:hypothetical protein
MIAHLWGNNKLELLIDPVRCVDANDNVKCIGYNDFSHMDWLGYQSGITPVFDTDSADRWFCVEAHVKLNDPVQLNGLQEFWIDGKHEARRENLNFVRICQNTKHETQKTKHVLIQIQNTTLLRRHDERKYCITWLGRKDSTGRFDRRKYQHRGA